MSGKENSANDLTEKDSLGMSSQEEDLDSIMQELESLDKEVEAVTAPAAAAPVAAAAPRAAAIPVARERDTESVAHLRSAAQATPASAAKRPAKANAAHSQSLTMELTGTLNLKLGFTTGSKSVELICTDEALVCRFGDGTEVRIPTENPRAATLRRTA